jgi:phage-related protein
MASMNTILGSMSAGRKSITNMLSPKGATSGGDITGDIANLLGGQLQSAANNIVLEIFIVVLAAIVIILVAYSLFKPLLTGIFNSILSTLDGITNITGDAIKEVTDIMSNTLETTNGLVVGTISTATVIINSLGVGINATISGATMTLNTLGNGLNTTLNTVTSTVVGTLSVSTKVVQETGNTIVAVEQGILSVAKDSVDSINSILSSTADSFQTVLTSMNDALITTTSTVVGGINLAIAPITNPDFGIPAIAKNMLSTTDRVVKTIDGFGDTITSAISTLSSITFI